MIGKVTMMPPIWFGPYLLCYKRYWLTAIHAPADWLLDLQLLSLIMFVLWPWGTVELLASLFKSSIFS